MTDRTPTAALDAAILEVVASGAKRFITIWTDPRVARLTKEASQPDRLVDRRLQALRKRGEVSYRSSTGWTVRREQ